VYGSLAFLFGFLLLLASFHSETGVVDVAVITGDAPPGTAERLVPLNRTSAFEAVLAAECGVEFYLLDDSHYAAYHNGGALPAPAMNCSNNEVFLQAPVGHLVTVYNAPPTAANISYAISASLVGTRTPFALLSIPGALIAFAGVVWIATGYLADETDRIRKKYRG